MAALGSEQQLNFFEMPHIDISDKRIVLYSFVILTVLRLLLSGCDAFGLRRIPSLFTHFINKYKIAQKGKAYKLSESIWYLFWHIFSLAATLVALHKEYGVNNNSWLYYFMKDLNGIWFFTKSPYTVSKAFAGWPFLTISAQSRYLTMISAGFWSSCLLYVNCETRRSDVNIMRFHHLTTLLLIVLAHVYNFHRISLFVIFIHDIPDVLLYLTKSYSYIYNKNEAVLGSMFVLYGLSHFITRFVLMLRYVIYPLILNLDSFDYVGGTINYLWDFPGGIICPASILCLTIMNIYWFNLILSMFKKFIIGSEKIADSREED